MGAGLGYEDAEGIWQFGELDIESLASDLLNIGQVKTSEAFTADRGRLTDLEEVTTRRFCVLTITAGSIANNSEISLGAAAPLWVEESDALGWHSASSNIERITPTVAGRYGVHLSSAWATNSTGVRLTRIRRNGAEIVSSDVVTAGTVSATGPAQISEHEVSMNGTTDYFDFRAYQNSGAARAGTFRAVVRYLGA